MQWSFIKGKDWFGNSKPYALQDSRPMQYFSHRLSVNDLAPLYAVPNSLVKEISQRGIDVAHEHKAKRDFHLPCKQVDGGKIQNQNNRSVTNGLNDRPAQGLFCMMNIGMKFFYHGYSFK
jgi:hypothetical protein